MKREKLRLDELLVARGLADSLAVAQARIIAGDVYQREVKLDKPGHRLPEDAEIRLREAEHPFVSRGGMKLAHGLEHFGINPEGRICIDVGSSTGGFTDVLLRHKAARVYAVDVGHGQLDWSLRQNPDVVVLEKTNARHLDAAIILEKPTLIVCDASFIRLRSVLPASLALMTEGYLIALVKPQFEVEKHEVGEGGVVLDPALHARVCEENAQWLGGLAGWSVLGLEPSPIKGPKGNTEFLLAARKTS